MKAIARPAVPLAASLLIVALLGSQVLPGALPAAHAQGVMSPEREDQLDGMQLRANYQRYYRQATLYGYKLAAYSADEVSETNNPLADGNRISNKRSSTRWRDQKGRVRIAYQTEGGKDRIFIADPGAKIAWLLRPDRKDVLCMEGAPAERRIGADFLYAPPAPEWNRQVTTQLGVKDVGGVKAAGALTETFYPAGARGNEKEMIDSTESWQSRELAETVYLRSVVAGREQVTRLDNLKLGDVPDSLFAIPADYAVRKAVVDKSVEVK